MAEIKITSIKLENYRQYFGSQSVSFPNREDGFAAIIGENGAGKSNLLNAINWCFYKKEPHTKKNEGYAIINQTYLDSVENDSIASMSVQIDLQKGEDEYRISRVLKVIKNEYHYEEIGSAKTLKMTDAQGYVLPWGCEVIENQSTFEILKRLKHEQNFHSDKTVSPNILMNEILPESLSSYFILDGEFLEKFWTGIQKVKIGIEQISQLHLLDQTINHLDLLRKSVPQLGKQDIDILTKKLNLNDYFEQSKDDKGNDNFSSEPRFDYDPENDENEFYHSTGLPRIRELKLDIEKMKNKATQVAEQFGASNVEAVKTLNEQFHTEESAYKTAFQNLQYAEKQYFSSYIENLPLFFLKPAIEYSIVIVDELRKKGDLPYEAKKIFTNDLLELGKCICQTDLESKLMGGRETNTSRLEVMKVRDNMAADQGLDASVNMKFYFEEKMLGDFNKFTTESFDDPRKELSKANQDALHHNTAIKEIKLKLQNLGSVDIDQLVRDHNYLIQRIEETTSEIKDIKSALKQNEIKNKEFRSDRKKLMGKDSKARKIAHEQSIWESVSEIFEKTFSELKTEIRQEVQSKTMEIFLQTMYKQNKFKSFNIEPNYSVRLIDQNDVSILGSLSAGESLFLALSFISAIRDVTGYKFPLVIDTPLGRVSGTPRYLLSQALPKYLPDEQIIFLATDTEFLNPDTNVHDTEGRTEKPFGQLLEEQIKVKYSLITGMENNAAKIIDYVPKWRKNN